MEKKKRKLLKNGFQILWRTSKVYCIGILTFSSFCGIIGPLNAIIYQRFLDEILHILQARKGIKYGIIFLILYSLMCLLSYILNLILNYIKQLFSDLLDLRITQFILKKSITFPMETFDNANVYNHINVGITQTTHNCLNLLDSLSESLYAIIKGIGYGIIIARFNCVIVLLSIISSLPVLYISIKTNEYWYSIFFERTEKLRLINYLKMIMIKNENIKEIKLFKVGEKIVDLIKNTFSDFLNNDKRVRKKFLLKKITTQSIDEIVTLFIKIAILFFALKGKNSVGTIILFFNSQENMKASLNELLNKISVLHNSILYLESLDAIENEKVEDENGKNSFNNKFHAIEFKNVDFKYPGKEQYALKNVSLKFERGKIYSIVGFNGSGKTTLIKLLLRLYKPTNGVILVDGENIENISLESYYSNISAVFQDFIKYPFSVWENIAVSERNNDSVDKERFESVIQLADIRNMINSFPDKAETLLMKDWTGGSDISQGQWQKIAIARCFYPDSSIAILDEPFSSIDAEAENRIIKRIKEQSKNELVLYVTHRFSSITLADTIIVLKNGEIEEQGDHETLMYNRGTYFTLYKAQYDKSL